MQMKFGDNEETNMKKKMPQIHRFFLFFIFFILGNSIYQNILSGAYVVLHIQP